MLKECLEAFEHLQKNEKNLVIDNYVLDEGTYLFINEEFKIKRYDVEKPKGKEKIDRTEDYEMFAKLDYNSRLVNMNKPIDKKKQIHSNNYFTFFVKKDTIKDKKLTPEVIEDYYNILQNPVEKYKGDKKSSKLYMDYEKEAGEVNKELVQKYKNFILENIFNSEEWLQGKGYLKIFFKANILDYERESKRYIIPNIFNNNFYNEEINGINIGLSSSNMGMNDKKPFLKHMNRKNQVPELITIDDAIKYKELFDYLYSIASIGINDVYVSERGICFQNLIEEDFTGIYMRIKKGKETEVHYLDKIIKYRNKIDSFYIENYLNVEYEKYKEFTILNKEVKSLYDIEKLIDVFFFNKYLVNNYFVEASNIKINDDKLKEILITYRMFFFRWFRLGNKEGVLEILKNLSIILLKNTVINNHFLKACVQLNIMLSLINYLEKGEENMADILKSLHENLSKKANSLSLEIIEDNREYYFAIGQVAYYLNSLSKSKNQNNIFLKQILDTSDNKRVILIITQMIKKYSYSDDINSRRFRQLTSMIFGYIVDDEKDDTMILLGYSSNNIIYQKKEDQNKGGEQNE